MTNGNVNAFEKRLARYIKNGKKITPAQILAQEKQEFFGERSRVSLFHCPKCNAPMEIGLALQGQEQDPNLRAEYTHYSNDDLEFKHCLKCPKCGASESL